MNTRRTTRRGLDRVRKGFGAATGQGEHTRRFARVRRLAQGLPRVVEGTTYGSPALKVGGRMFTCIAIHRSAERGSLAVRVPFADRDELVANAPDIYYLTDHYVDYPCVLVRLDRIGDDALADLLRMGWTFAGRAHVRRTRAPELTRRGASAARKHR